MASINIPNYPELMALTKDIELLENGIAWMEDLHNNYLAIESDLLSAAPGNFYEGAAKTIIDNNRVLSNDTVLNEMKDKLQELLTTLQGVTITIPQQ